MTRLDCESARRGWEIFSRDIFVHGVPAHGDRWVGSEGIQRGVLFPPVDQPALGFCLHPVLCDEAVILVAAGSDNVEQWSNIWFDAIDVAALYPAHEGDDGGARKYPNATTWVDREYDYRLNGLNPIDSSAPKGKLGRKPKISPDEAKRVIFQMMDENGDFSPLDDADWDGPAKAVKLLLEHCENVVGKPIAESTAYEYINRYSREWRLQNSGN